MGMHIKYVVAGNTPRSDTEEFAQILAPTTVRVSVFFSNLYLYSIHYKVCLSRKNWRRLDSKLRRFRLFLDTVFKFRPLVNFDRPPLWARLKVYIDTSKRSGIICL